MAHVLEKIKFFTSRNNLERKIKIREMGARLTLKRCAKILCKIISKVEMWRRGGIWLAVCHCPLPLSSGPFAVESSDNWILQPWAKNRKYPYYIALCSTHNPLVINRQFILEQHIYLVCTAQHSSGL